MPQNSISKNSESHVLHHFIVFSIYSLLAALIYSTTLHYGFFLDDTSQIIENPLVHDLSKWFLNFKFSTMASSDSGHDIAGVYYKPMMTIAYSFLWNIGHGQTFSFRIFQLFLHVLNSYLVFQLFRHFFSKNTLTLAFIAGLIFLCHPINSEAVLLIPDLQEPLYTFFGITGLITFIRLKSSKHLLLVGLLFLCSLLSKETGLLYILSAFAYCLIFAKDRIKGLSVVVLAIGLAYFSLRLGVANLTSLHSNNTQLARADLLTRLMTMPKVLVHYLHLFLFPNELSLTQDWIVTTFTFSDFWLPLTEVLAFLFLLTFYVFKKKDKIVLLFFIIFGLGWGLHSQLIPLDGTVSDRWFYFTIIGLLGLILKIVELEFTVSRIKLLAFAVICGSVFSLRTYSRTQDWRNDLELYQHDAGVDPDSFYLNNNLGLAYLVRGRLAEAAQSFEKTISVSQKGSIAWLTGYRNLGAVYLDLKQYSQAEDYFRISIADNSVGSYRGLAGSLQGQQKYQELQQFLENDALKKFPQDPLLLSIQRESSK